MSQTRKNAIKRTKIQTRKNGKISAAAVLVFMSENPEYLPSVENYGDYTTEEEIYRVRLILWHTAARLKRYVGLAKERKVPSISEADLVSLIGAATQKKYRERESPPFGANKLCGAMLKGNDKKMYISEKRGSACVWTLVQ
jgi:hypothetical protein